MLNEAKLGQCYTQIGRNGRLRLELDRDGRKQKNSFSGCCCLVRLNSYTPPTLTGLFSFFFFFLLFPQTPGQFNCDDSNECQHKKKQRPLATRTSQSTHPPSRTVKVFFNSLLPILISVFDCFVWEFHDSGPAHDIFLSTLDRVSDEVERKERKPKKKNLLFGCVTIGIVAIKLLALFCFSPFSFFHVCVCVGRPKSHQVLT